MSVRVVLITGSNLGNREQNLKAAREALENKVGKLLSVSSVYESEPWGEMNDDGGAFLNQVLVLETELEPLKLLDVTQDIEFILGRSIKGNGRVRKSYDSRTMDIDILYYADRIVDEERLTIPHPDIPHREFVLIPMTEVLADMSHPLTGKTASEMLDQLRGNNNRKKHKYQL